MKYIYKITSPSGKVYIGQSTVDPTKKKSLYRSMEAIPSTRRKIINAIRKYTWDQMKFEIIEQNDFWSPAVLNEREIFWIAFYNSVECGYNMTKGGEGVDSECARKNTVYQHENMSLEKKMERRKNCSIGQRKRFQENPESIETRRRKKESHSGRYLIESPDGRKWDTELGLKDFADQFADEIKITYWQLFNAYRKSYNNVTTTKKRKDQNNWKVTRIDK